MDFVSRQTDPGTVVTVSRVALSPDLKNGTAFLLIYPETHAREMLATLQSCVSELNRQLFKTLRMKTPPKVAFTLDAGERRRQRIEEILRQEKKT